MGKAERASALEASIKEQFPGVATEVTPRGELVARVSPGEYLDFCRYLRDQQGFKFLSMITAVDYPPDRFELVLYLDAYGATSDAPAMQVMDTRTRQEIGQRSEGLLTSQGTPVMVAATVASVIVKCDVPHDAPVIPSVTSLWPTANWHEREVYDLMGIKFEGHPDLRRILLPDWFPGHPLRKDFTSKPALREPEARPWPVIWPDQKDGRESGE